MPGGAATVMDVCDTVELLEISVVGPNVGPRGSRTMNPAKATPPGVRKAGVK
jgi:hypothetical protein